MNNFHIRIEDCTEAQKSIIQRIYGGVGLYEYLVSLTDVNIMSKHYASNSKLITPDEAFKRLGLDNSTMLTAALETIDALGETAKESEKKIKGLEAQLAKQPLDVDWNGLADGTATAICQIGNDVFATINGHYWFCGCWRMDDDDTGKTAIATRPKPKYTKEQTNITNEVYEAFKEMLRGEGQDTITFQQWLKEQEQ